MNIFTYEDLPTMYVWVQVFVHTHTHVLILALPHIHIYIYAQVSETICIYMYILFSSILMRTVASVLVYIFVRKCIYNQMPAPACVNNSEALFLRDKPCEKPSLCVYVNMATYMSMHTYLFLCTHSHIQMRVYVFEAMHMCASKTNVEYVHTLT